MNDLASLYQGPSCKTFLQLLMHVNNWHALASACMACDMTRQMREVSVVTALCLQSASSALKYAWQCGHDVKSNLHCYQFEADDAAEMCILSLADCKQTQGCCIQCTFNLSKRVLGLDQEVAGMHRTMSGNTLAHPSARASTRFAGRKPRAKVGSP